MPYTFMPKEKHAKAYGEDMRISKKNAEIICSVIKNKPLTRSKRLLEDLKSKKRNLKGKYYSHAVKGIIMLLNSCEKNAENLGLDTGRLFVHASAHKGRTLQRRRRKAAFGSRLKTANVEIMLIEKGTSSTKLAKEEKPAKMPSKNVAEKKEDKPVASGTEAEKELQKENMIKKNTKEEKQAAKPEANTNSAKSEEK